MTERDARYPQAFKHLMKFEGGYVNDPDDSGRETFRGISRRSWPAWPGWLLIDEAKAKLGGVVKTGKGKTNIDDYFEGHEQIDDLVRDFYFFEFWSPAARLELSPRLTEKLFDTSVHVGYGPMITLLQMTVNLFSGGSGLEIDGKAGKLTMAALNSVVGNLGEDMFLIAFCGSQTGYYLALTQQKPSQRKYLKGWLSRAAWLPK